MKHLLSFLICILVSNNLLARTVITMEQDGGVYKVPCEVNGLRMKFIFDTGASNVCISQSMANYMLENDYLESSDILGSGQSSVADGRIVDHVRINLSTLKIGSVTLSDVEAVVISGQSSPLLLGQSAISKLGKVSINNNQLIIEDAGECTDEDIDNWSSLADDYLDKCLYDRAIWYYEKINDCDRLSDYGQYILGTAYASNKNYKKAIDIYSMLERKNDNQETDGTIDRTTYVDMLKNLAFCYMTQGNFRTCIMYDKKLLLYNPKETWEYTARAHYEMAVCYENLDDFSNSNSSALLAIACILRFEYPAVHQEWTRNNGANLGPILQKYNLGRNEMLGDCIALFCSNVAHTTGDYYCQMMEIAFKLGSSRGRDSYYSWRSSGICR